jgi:hypothetical protein
MDKEKLIKEAIESWRFFIMKNVYLNKKIIVLALPAKVG